MYCPICLLPKASGRLALTLTLTVYYPRHRGAGWILLTHGELSHMVGAYVANQGIRVRVRVRVRVRD